VREKFVYTARMGNDMKSVYITLGAILLSALLYDKNEHKIFKKAVVLNLFYGEYKNGFKVR